jgi:hypothetical protein
VIHDSVHSNETIELPSGDTSSIARSTFHQCLVLGKTAASNLTVIDSVFEQCEVHWKGVLKNKSWLSVVFSGCAFRGEYTGNRFGHEKRIARPGAMLGGMVDCDMSESSLDGTSFLNCDTSRIKFPSWPFFTLLSPTSYSEELVRLSESMPRPLQTTVRVSATAHPETSAVTWSAAKLVKDSGLDEATILNIVKTLPQTLF